jgi:hypothetical protein
MRPPAPAMTWRDSGSRPSWTRWASAAQAGTIRGAPPGGAHSTSSTEGPWRGSKKHGARRSGTGRPSRMALVAAISYRPASRAALTGARSSVRRARSRASDAFWYWLTASL